MCVCALFTNLDGTDGKQARRTGSSTPVGELFDHGLDSMVAGSVMTLGVFSINGRGAEDYCMTAAMLFLVEALVFGGFYLAHWETYLTGVFCLPWLYDPSQVVSCLSRSRELHCYALQSLALLPLVGRHLTTS